VNPVKGEGVAPTIGLPSESVRAIPEPASEVMALDKPDPRGWVAFTSPEAPAIGAPVAPNAPAVTFVVLGRPSSPVDTAVPPKVRPAAGMRPDPVEAATVVMGDPLTSYEVDAMVPLARVGIELMIAEGRAVASDVIGRLSGPNDVARAVV
jgi:hypothetical protein